MEYFQSESRYLMIPGCDPDIHDWVSSAIHDALRYPICQSRNPWISHGSSALSASPLGCLGHPPSSRGYCRWICPPSFW